MALVPGYSSCQDTERAQIAEQNGAAAMLIQAPRTLSGPYENYVDAAQVTIPMLGISYLLGKDLASQSPLVTISVQGGMQVSYTSNLLAETTTGSTDSVILVGSHLDSVPAGPGINDNGSGSSISLEIALEMAKQGITFPNQIRFAWWGAEELGLLGSEFYVNSLSQAGAFTGC